MSTAKTPTDVPVDALTEKDARKELARLAMDLSDWHKTGVRPTH